MALLLRIAVAIVVACVGNVLTPLSAEEAVPFGPLKLLATRFKLVAFFPLERNLQNIAPDFSYDSAG